MKRKSIIFLSLLFAVGITPIFSQSVSNTDMSSQNFNKFYEAYTANNLRDGTSKYSNIEGTPYLNNEFMLSELILEDKKPLKAKLRLNLYTDEMEIKYNNQIRLLNLPLDLTEIVIADHRIIYSRYLLKKKEKKGYFFVEISGEYSFLIKREIILNDAQREEPYKTAKPASFSEYKEYFYIKKGDQPAIFFKNVKDLSKSLPEQKGNIDAFTKSNKIRKTEIKDWQKLFEYLNSL